MKVKSLVTLGVTVVLIVLVAMLALNGLQIGKYIFKSVPSAISLGLDLRGGIYAVYQGDTSVEDFDTQMNATVVVLRTRLTNQGFTEATVTRQGEDRIRIEIPDVQDPNAILDIIGTPAFSKIGMAADESPENAGPAMATKFGSETILLATAAPPSADAPSSWATISIVQPLISPASLIASSIAFTWSWPYAA